MSMVFRLTMLNLQLPAVRGFAQDAENVKSAGVRDFGKKRWGRPEIASLEQMAIDLVAGG